MALVVSHLELMEIIEKMWLGYITHRLHKESEHRGCPHPGASRNRCSVGTAEWRCRSCSCSVIATSLTMTLLPEMTQFRWEASFPHTHILHLPQFSVHKYKRAIMTHFVPWTQASIKYTMEIHIKNLFSGFPWEVFRWIWFYHVYFRVWKLTCLLIMFNLCTHR